MCVVSMVMDHYTEKWGQPKPFSIPSQPFPGVSPFYPAPKIPTQEEVDEFYKLLKRAREYDVKNNEPDCEMEEKKQRLQKLADELGITIKFE